MDSQGQHGTVIEFWTTRRVLEVTGLSHSELYRQIEQDRFPKPEKYRGTKRNYWPSPVVQKWQRDEIGVDEFAALMLL